jgi:hypothetical protein
VELIKIVASEHINLLQMLYHSTLSQMYYLNTYIKYQIIELCMQSTNTFVEGMRRSGLEFIEMEVGESWQAIADSALFF